MDIEKKIEFIAETTGLKLTENKDKVIRAKKMLFANGNMLRCPCDSKNEDRFCVSETCMDDIMRDGHCHCNLFKYE